MYNATKDPDSGYSKEAELEEEYLNSMVDDILTATANGEEYKGYKWDDVLGYLSDEGVAAWEEYTRQAFNGAIYSEAASKFDLALSDAAREIAEKILKSEVEK